MHRNTSTFDVLRQPNSPIVRTTLQGNGVMETTVAEFLTQLDPALFTIDCLPNMDATTVNNRTVPLVKYLRAKHPTVPILLTAGTTCVLGSGSYCCTML